MTLIKNLALTAAVAQTSYKPGWTFSYEAESWRDTLTITALMTDARDPLRMCNFIIRRTIPGYVTGAGDRLMENYLSWLADVLREIEFHEIWEFLRYDGELVRDPHAGTPAPQAVPA